MSWLNYFFLEKQWENGKVWFDSLLESTALQVFEARMPGNWQQFCSNIHRPCSTKQNTPSSSWYCMGSAELQPIKSCWKQSRHWSLAPTIKIAGWHTSCLLMQSNAIMQLSGWMWRLVGCLSQSLLHTGLQAELPWTMQSLLEKSLSCLLITYALTSLSLYIRDRLKLC